MDINVPARQLLAALRGFQPHAKGRKFEQEYVRATAGGGMLILRGSYDNSASLAADVNYPGDVHLPLESTLKLLKTYKGKAGIQIRSDAESLWLGPVKLALRDPDAKPKRQRAAVKKIPQSIKEAVPWTENNPV